MFDVMANAGILFIVAVVDVSVLLLLLYVIHFTNLLIDARSVLAGDEREGGTFGDPRPVAERERSLPCRGRAFFLGSSLVCPEVFVCVVLVSGRDKNYIEKSIRRRGT